MSSEILRNSLLAARDLLTQTADLVAASRDPSFGTPDLDASFAQAGLDARLVALVSEINDALAAPAPCPTTPEPRQPFLADVDLDVIARSCEWSIDQDGHLFGLTKEHGHYEFTGIVLDSESLAAWKREYIEPAALTSARGSVQSPGEALAIARANEQKLRWELNMWRHGFLKAKLAEEAQQIQNFLHSVPLIPEVELPAGTPIETGPWSVGQTREATRQRTFVESDDFTHDVRLYIDGDFAGDEARQAYAEMLAAKLNVAFNAVPRPKRGDATVGRAFTVRDIHRVATRELP